MYRNLYRMSQAGKREIEPLAHFPFYFTGSLSNPDRFGWPISDLASSVIFDWAAKDGLLPYVGPELSVSGAISDVSTPFNCASGANIIAKNMNNEKLSAAPGPSMSGTLDDVYIAILAKPGVGDDVSSPAYGIVLLLGERYGSTNSISIKRYQDDLYLTVNGATSEYSQVSTSCEPNNWMLIQVYINRNSNQIRFFVNDQAGAIDVVPAGSIYNAEIISISGRYDAVNRTNFDIARVLVCAGLGITNEVVADSEAFVYNMLNHSLGCHSLKGSDTPDFGRSSIVCAEKNSKLYMYYIGAPASGSEGLTISSEATTKCYNNINPQATTGWTGVGAVTVNVIADDLNDLSGAGSVDCSEFGPAVIEINNPTGGDGYAYNGAATGNTNKHSLQVRGKHVTGSSGFQLGFYDTVGASFSQGVEINDSYEITKNENLTPIATDILAIKVPAGQKIYVIAQQLEEEYLCTQLIPNFATGSTAARARQTLDTKYAYDNTKGAIRFQIRMHASAGVLSTQRVFSDPVVLFDSGSSYIRAYDGTNTAQPEVDVYDGAWHDVLISWGAPGLKASTDGTIVITSFDGSIGFTGGTIVLGGSSLNANFDVRNLKFYDDYI